LNSPNRLVGRVLVEGHDGRGPAQLGQELLVDLDDLALGVGDGDDDLGHAGLARRVQVDLLVLVRRDDGLGGLEKSARPPGAVGFSWVM